MSYAEKLKDPRWQRKRLEVMSYADFRCQVCGSKDNTLNVHHSYYENGKNPWDYPTGSLLCACEQCHEGIEGFLKRGKRFQKSKPPAAPTPEPPVSKWSIQQRHAFKLYFHFPEMLPACPRVLAEVAIRAKMALEENQPREYLLKEFSTSSWQLDEFTEKEKERLINAHPDKQIEDISMRVVNQEIDKSIDYVCMRAAESNETEFTKLMAIMDRLRDVKSDPNFDADTRLEQLECIQNNEDIFYEMKP